MEITKLEKAALLTTGAGASFLTLLWLIGASIESSAPAIFWLRIVFAAVSFAAFDLVLWSLVEHGWSGSGALALLVTSAVSGLIGLEASGVVNWPALHAAPALTLAAFGLHLMWARRLAPAVATTEPQSAITQAVQVNVGTPLPRTLIGYIAARAAALPDHSHDQLAAEIGTSTDTVRRALEAARASATIEQEATQ